MPNKTFFRTPEHTRAREIALIYFSQSEKDQYLEYIALLPANGYLTNDISS